MSVLVAIGYDDEATAAKAAEEVGQLEHDLLIEPDAVAVIVRDGDGSYHVQTNHHLVSGRATYGMVWGALFGLLFFVPVFGMAVGAGLGALIGKVEKIGIDRGVPGPGSRAAPTGLIRALSGGRGSNAGGGDRGVERLRRRGAQASLSPEAEAELQDHLHGAATA